MQIHNHAAGAHDDLINAAAGALVLAREDTAFEGSLLEHAMFLDGDEMVMRWHSVH